jgi:hypothetical protein
MSGMYLYILPFLAGMFIFIGCLSMRSVKKELAMTRDKRVFRFVKERQG